MRRNVVITIALTGIVLLGLGSFKAFSELFSLGSGPILYLPFNGNVKDESGLENKVIQAGGQLTGDRYARAQRAFELDGVNDYLEIPDDKGRFSINKMTIAFWFNTDSDKTQNIIGKENFSTAEEAVMQVFINWEEYPGLGFNLVANDSYCTETRNLTSTYANGGTIEKGAWHFAAATWDGTTQKIYLDGKLINSQTPSRFGTVKKCGSPIRIGVWYQGAIPYDGKIDEVYIYRRALTKKELDKLSKRRR